MEIVNQDPANDLLTAIVSDLNKEVERLRAENVTIRTENQFLREELDHWHAAEREA